MNIDTVNLPHLVQNKEITTTNTQLKYEILNYDAKMVQKDNTEVFKYRSVVIDPENNHLLCVSPCKSATLESFLNIEKENASFEGERIRFTQGQTVEKWVADEMIEGTMINLFYDNRLGGWEISTRGAIGGKYWFYRTEYSNSYPNQKTFYEMFMEALRQDNNQTLNEIGLICDLPKCYCYSFVLQHPENHIVYQIREPKLYLVGVYECINHTSSGTPCLYDIETRKWNEQPRMKYLNTHSDAVQHIFVDWLSSGVLYLPKVYEAYDVDELRMLHCNELKFSMPMGIMITNIHTGERWALENSRYQSLKELRGNNPNLQYHFFVLNRIGKTHDFIRVFPHYSKLFHLFFNTYRHFLLCVHSGYVQYYIMKNKTPIDKKFFVHIAKIHHEVYLPSMAQNEKKIITYNVVREYFEKMEPRELLYHVNYDARVKNPA